MQDNKIAQERNRGEGQGGAAPLVGTVIEVLAGGCRVQYAEEVLWCVPRGVLKRERRGRQRNLIAVGDRVRFLVTGKGQGVFEEVLPRRNKLTRPDPFNPAMEHVIASNLDQLIIIVSAQKPPLDREILDRCLLASENLNLEPVICVNKVDLEPDERLRDQMRVYSQMGYRMLFTSAVTGTGLEALKEALKDKLRSLGYL